ncbi:MAG: GYDIA family GHMP kinase [Bacteroidales bacterium]
MKFYSRGKLLISGEYLVLKGATALTVPLNKGQNLVVSNGDNKAIISWESREYGNPWFSTKIKLPFFDIIESTDQKLALNLIRHLKAAVKLQPDFKEKLAGADIITDLEFKRSWGFGSSSSLVSNIAYWAELDPFLLHQKVSDGSGYDVVVARKDEPIFFTLKKRGFEEEKVKLNKSVTDFIYFVYLGKKKDSAKSVAKFLASKKSFRLEKRMVSELSRHMAGAIRLEDFDFYMKEHEQILSSILKQPGLKEHIFSDLKGEAKSLGAWGGDFAMITFNGEKKEIETYLKDKKLEVWFTWNELVKT